MTYVLALQSLRGACNILLVPRVLPDLREKPNSSPALHSHTHLMSAFWMKSSRRAHQGTGWESTPYRQYRRSTRSTSSTLSCPAASSVLWSPRFYRLKSACCSSPLKSKLLGFPAFFFSFPSIDNSLRLQWEWPLFWWFDYVDIWYLKRTKVYRECGEGKATEDSNCWRPAFSCKDSITASKGL